MLVYYHFALWKSLKNWGDINLNTKNTVRDFYLSNAGVQRKVIFFDFSSVQFLYQYTEFWMSELTYFSRLYFGLWLTIWMKGYAQSRFSVLSLWDLYCPEIWTKSSGRKVRTNSSFPSAPLNHMSLNINETFMNHT